MVDVSNKDTIDLSQVENELENVAETIGTVCIMFELSTVISQKAGG